MKYENIGITVFMKLMEARRIEAQQQTPRDEIEKIYLKNCIEKYDFIIWEINKYLKK